MPRPNPSEASKYQGLKPVEVSAPGVYDDIDSITARLIANGYSEDEAIEAAADRCERMAIDTDNGMGKYQWG